jgi:hypothetical protein
MLLPEGATRSASTEYLLAVQDNAPHIVGAACYTLGVRYTYGFGCRVIRPLRRRSIGTELLQHVISLAQWRGHKGVIAVAGSVEETDSVGFLEHHGFRLANRTTTVHAGMQTAIEIISPLAARIRRSQHFVEARLVRLADAPRNAVVELYVEELARNPLTTPWTLVDQIADARFAQSPVLMFGDRIAGLLIWEVHDTLARVPARIVAPGFQGGPANVLLMDNALHVGWAAGAREIEFEIPMNNSDTEKLARRFGARQVRTTENYLKELASA